MAPIAIATLIGLVAGALRRGRLASLTQARLKRPILLGLAVVCAVGADVFDLPAPAVLAFVGLLAGIWFAGSNLLIPGMAIIGLGVAANLLPVALNGAMPVRADALVNAEIVAESDVGRVELRGARELADADTRLEILGDVIPVPTLEQVLSFGDLIILVGLADVVANLMRARRPKRLPRGAAPTLVALGWDVPPDDDIFVDLRERIDEELRSRPSTPARRAADRPAAARPAGVARAATPADPDRDTISAFSPIDNW